MITAVTVAVVSTATLALVAAFGLGWGFGYAKARATLRREHALQNEVWITEVHRLRDEILVLDEQLAEAKARPETGSGTARPRATDVAVELGDLERFHLDHLAADLELTPGEYLAWLLEGVCVTCHAVTCTDPAHAGVHEAAGSLADGWCSNCETGLRPNGPNTRPPDEDTPNGPRVWVCPLCDYEEDPADA